MKPAGLSQHSDTLYSGEEEESKGEMGKADVDEKHGKTSLLGVREYMNPSSFLTDLLQSSCLKL